jgi:hypothetical protein
MNFTNVLGLIEDIPATFWGVLFGSFFSILAVWLTNRASEVRLNNQFRHELLVKSTERELALKKDIFLDAAEAVSAAISSLSNFANLDKANDKVMESYLEKSRVLAKVHVVGTMQTVDSLANLMDEHRKQVFNLWVVRHQLNAQKSAIANVDNLVARFQKEVDVTLELIKQFNISGIGDQQRWSHLQKNVEFEMKRVDDGLAKRGELVQKLTGEHVAFIAHCSRASSAVAKHVVPLVKAIRNELNLPFDLDEYQARINQSLSKQIEDSDQYLAKVSEPSGSKSNESEVE